MKLKCTSHSIISKMTGFCLILFYFAVQENLAISSVQITEFLYSGESGEFFELTNIGNTPIDLTGYTYIDAARTGTTLSLSAFGIIQPQESVVVTESDANAFRTSWSLPSSVKIIGGNTINLGRADEINIYDASNNLVDRLTYGDQTYAGTIRTQNKSGWANLEHLGSETITSSWVLSALGDAKASYASSAGDIGNPGIYFVKPGVQVQQTSGNTAVAEGGSSDEIAIVLLTQPTDTVLVKLSSKVQIGLNKVQLIFTSSNWNIAQTVTVTAIDDATSEGSHSDTVFLSVQSKDANYHAFTLDQIPVVVSDNEKPAPAIRITEYMYSGNGSEFVELTNVGDSAVDLIGWSFSNKSRSIGSFQLTGLGIIKAGESVVLTDGDASDFRIDWKLCQGIKVLGGNTQGIGRNDELNLYDNGNALVDQLIYNDEGASPVNAPRTQKFSAWPGLSALGKNMANLWNLSAVGDQEKSYSSVGGDIGNPGKSSLAKVSFDPCFVDPNAPVIAFDPIKTSNLIDGGNTYIPAVSATVGTTDPTDPMRTLGVYFIVNDAQGTATTVVTAASDNPKVVPANKITITKIGNDTINVKVQSDTVGYSNITVKISDGTFESKYSFKYAASAPGMSSSRYHTGKSDASTALAIDANYMLVADDEDQQIRLYHRYKSGLPVKSFDFSLGVALDTDDELDIESSARTGNTIYWLGSHTNSSGGGDDPDRERIFSTNISGTGESTSLSFGAYYKHLATDLVNWDNNNIHGLGTKYFDFASGAAGGLPPENINGFSLEGLSIAPGSNHIFYLGFRAPVSPASDRKKALIVPLTNLASILDINGGTAGSAVFGTPVLLDLDGRTIRSIECNDQGCLIMAGNATAGKNFKLYKWTGNPDDSPIQLLNDFSANSLLGGANDGSLESIIELPQGAMSTWHGQTFQLLMDNGDDIYYGDGEVAKDLDQTTLKKFRSDLVVLKDNSTYVPKINKNIDIRVYPNPAENVLYFEDKESCKIELQDVFGRKYEVSIGQGQIDLQKLAPGLYLLNFTSSQGKMTVKFQKK